MYRRDIYIKKIYKQRNIDRDIYIQTKYINRIEIFRKNLYIKDIY